MHRMHRRLVRCLHRLVYMEDVIHQLVAATGLQSSTSIGAKSQEMLCSYVVVSSDHECSK